MDKILRFVSIYLQCKCVWLTYFACMIDKLNHYTRLVFSDSSTIVVETIIYLSVYFIRFRAPNLNYTTITNK